MFHLPKMLFAGLLALLVVSLTSGCATAAPAQTDNQKAAQMASAAAAAEGQKLTPPDRLEIVYFHRANPCHCMAVVEDYIKTVVYLDFSSELNSGRLVYRSIVSDDRANRELVAKYGAYLFQLFFTEYRGKQEKTYPVDDIWALRGDPEKLKAFLRETIRKSLDGEMYR